MILKKEIGILASVAHIDNRVEYDGIECPTEKMAHQCRFSDLSGAEHRDHWEMVKEVDHFILN